MNWVKGNAVEYQISQVDSHTTPNYKSTEQHLGKDDSLNQEGHMINS